MEFFRIHKTIPFMRFSHILNAISFISFAVAVYWIFAHGLAFSIEFTGGTQVVVNYPQAVSAEEVRGQIQQGLKVVIGIMIYLAFRFEWKFAVAAIIANLHDVIIVIGIFAIMQWEFSLPVLAAVLAVLGYSVNESVIIFDRVREHFRKMRRTSTVEVINSAITATISRTVITHTSTLAMTLSMFFFGGPALHHFSLALTIGICLGIYSSVFVAAAIAMYLGVKREDLVKPVKKDEVQEMVP